MATYQWDGALSVGNQNIDDDHKVLIDTVGRLHEAMRTGQSKEVVGAILDDLVRSTEEHFEREEGFMLKINYVDYLPHKAEHERLLREVRDLQSRFNAGTITITVSVSNFLSDWLVKHILGLDKKLAATIAKASA